MKTAILKGQGIVAHNQYGPKNPDPALPNGELVPPECPECLARHAREYYKEHVGHLCKDRILGMSNWEFFVMMCAAWGDWQKWTDLVAEAEKSPGFISGIVDLSGRTAKVSVIQREKQKAEKHYRDTHIAFFKQAKTVFGAQGEEEDDGYDD